MRRSAVLSQYRGFHTCLSLQKSKRKHIVTTLSGTSPKGTPAKNLEKYEQALSESVSPEQRKSLAAILKASLEASEARPKSKNKGKEAEQDNVDGERAREPERDVPPHNLASQNIFPLGYNRRIESLHEYSTGPVLQELEPPEPQKPVATLAHGLNRVLFNPGVHWLQDPRTRVFNFTPWLKHIPPLSRFDIKTLSSFTPSSKDRTLLQLAKEHNKAFCGSTSSLTGMLSHIYFLISQDKEVDISPLSEAWRNERRQFTPGQRMPVTVQMNWHEEEEVYSIDSASGAGSEGNVLLWMGHLLEKFLTMGKEEFVTKFLTADEEGSDAVAAAAAALAATAPVEKPSEEESLSEAYRYSKSEHFVMRSQLDCRNPHLPGSGVFDIKTRASMPIRMDILNFAESSGSLIRSRHGLTESFEREYYDLIRSAFLKYAFQARIGGMDGVLVAYHNTGQMFGFEYFGLSEMEERIFGSPTAGERVFSKCVGLLEILGLEIKRCFPGETVRCTFETRAHGNRLEVYVEPVEKNGTLMDETGDRIKMIEVQASSFVGNQRVRGARAVESDQPWTIHYIITHSLGTPSEIRSKLKEVEERKIRGWVLPTGVGPSEVSEWWSSLGFISGENPMPNLEMFQPPDKETLEMRQKARSGREETKKWKDLDDERGFVQVLEPASGEIVAMSVHDVEDYGYPEGPPAVVAKGPERDSD